MKNQKLCNLYCPNHSMVAFYTKHGRLVRGRWCARDETFKDECMMAAFSECRFRDTRNYSCVSVDEAPSGWMPSVDACDTLGITPRALRKRVQAGTMERKRLGRRSLYRLVEAPC